MRRVGLAGMAEWLSNRYHYPIPAWTLEPQYFLDQERNWLEEVVDNDLLTLHRDCHLRRSAPEFLKRNLIFPVLALCRV